MKDGIQKKGAVFLKKRIRLRETSIVGILN
jgi:hypothetical protein